MRTFALARSLLLNDVMASGTSCSRSTLLRAVTRMSSPGVAAAGAVVGAGSPCVTGAGSGIGRAASLLFTKEGARLIAVDRTAAHGVVEQVAAHLPEDAQLGFYRTAAGAEMDIAVQAGRRSLGIEVKFSSAPTVTKGFWHAREDLQLTRAVVVAPVERRYPLTNGVEVAPVSALPELLAELG